LHQQTSSTNYCRLLKRKAMISVRMNSVLLLLLCIPLVFSADPLGCFSTWTCQTGYPQVFWTGTSACPSVGDVFAQNGIPSVLIYSSQPNQLYYVQSTVPGDTCTLQGYGPACSASTVLTRTDGIIGFTDCLSQNPECAFTDSVPATTTWNVDLPTNPAVDFPCTQCFTGTFPNFGQDIPGGDFSDFDLSSGDTYLTCAQDCAANPECTYWAYSYPVGSACTPFEGYGPDGAFGHCWLKTGSQPAVVNPSGCRIWGTPANANACFLTPVQVIPNTNFPGKRDLSHNRAIRMLMQLNQTNPIPSNVWKIVGL